MFQRFASPASLVRQPGPLGPLSPLGPFLRSGPVDAHQPGRGSPAGQAARLLADRGRVEAAAWRDEAAPDESDPMAQMAQADAADASLMRLVLCAASATLALALASSLL